jgi:hypothetical protein
MAVSYILLSFGVFFPVLGTLLKRNLAALRPRGQDYIIQLGKKSGRQKGGRDETSTTTWMQKYSLIEIRGPDFFSGSGRALTHNSGSGWAWAQASHVGLGSGFDL